MCDKAMNEGTEPVGPKLGTIRYSRSATDSTGKPQPTFSLRLDSEYQNTLRSRALKVEPKESTVQRDGNACLCVFAPAEPKRMLQLALVGIAIYHPRLKDIAS